MRLNDLLRHVPGARLRGSGDTEVSSVCYDSRKAEPGAIFVAIAGFKVDGHRFIGQALSAGASAVVISRGSEGEWSSPILAAGAAAVVVRDTRSAMAQVAAAVEGHPARSLRTIGITGTDGKTSLAHLLEHLMDSARQKTGLISTAECRIGQMAIGDTGRFTTPESPELQSMLAQMVAAGCRWAVIEATSHGLALHRVDECEYDIAVMTNVGSDHLDFHGTVEQYLAAKGRLFEMLDTAVNKKVPKTAILNVDDPAHRYFRGLTHARVLSYGLNAPAEISAKELDADGWSSRLLMMAAGEEAEVRLSRPGGFNSYNVVAATACGLAAGLDLATIIRGLETWQGAPGRMELIDEGQKFSVIVDFAHAPDSLRRMLEFLRSRSRGRIIIVFGCIGERDKDRRYGMGRVAAEAADYTIVTDDNPYTEDRDVIIAEIVGGLRESGKREGHDFAVIPDRREAIRQALGMAVDEDVVLLAGKGHEREVHLGDTSYECNDGEVARRVLAELTGNH